MSKIILYILLLVSLAVKAQYGYVYTFEQMPVAEIKDYGIEKLLEEAHVYDANLFYTTECRVGNEQFSALGYRNKLNRWNVYKTPFGDRMEVDFLGYSDNKDYAFFVSAYFANGNDHENKTSDFYIISLVNGTYTVFTKDEYSHSWEYQDGDCILSSYLFTTRQIMVNGNKFSVLQSDFSAGGEESEKDEAERNFGLHDSASGVYEIQGEKLVKTHYYNAITMQMQPIAYAGKLASGMVLRDITDAYSPYEDSVELKEVPRSVYGDDSEEMGYEVWWEDKPQYFLTVPDRYADVRRIAKLTVISPEIEVYSLHTDMEVGNILNQFPNARLHIDLVNDWEYMYIKESGLTLVFKTDESSRIAKYKYNWKTGDDEAVKIINKKRKLDYISVF